MRPSFLDDVSTAEARRGAGCPCLVRCTGGRPGGGNAACRARVIGHAVSRGYVLEYPVDDPDEDDEDFDEDDEGEDEDDEDEDEEEVETWQVCPM